MKIINTQGITYLEKVEGCSNWYWGTDYIHGDLYEAEQLFHNHHAITSNRLLLIRYPEGDVFEPKKPQKGCYFGQPIYYDGHIILLWVDFNQQLIFIEQYDETTSEISIIAAIGLHEVKDCYNLSLQIAPLMLTRRGGESQLEIIYPEKMQYQIGERESFYFRKGDKLYFSYWFEDGAYHEQCIVRDIHTGEVIERITGAITIMPDGQVWVLC